MPRAHNIGDAQDHTLTKPRKSPYYHSDVRILLRDAMPTYAKIEGEPDPRKGDKNERTRDIAKDELIKLYLWYEKHRALHLLDPQVRIFCDDLKARNGGRFPARKGGRRRATDAADASGVGLLPYGGSQRGAQDLRRSRGTLACGVTRGRAARGLWCGVRSLRERATRMGHGARGSRAQT